MHKRLRTVFFGSGPVALQSLKLLVSDFDLEAIVTKPSTQAEMQRAFPDVPTYAVQRRAELDELCRQQHFQSQFGIVIDFGVIIDQAAIDSFPLGIINSHFSLLPQWRGVDPITFAILSGQKQTGVSLMLIVRAWDEGPLLAQAPYSIPADATTPQLTEDLIDLSDALLKEIVPLYVAGEIEPHDQLAATIGSKEPTYSHKLTKADGRIDWTKPAAQLEREIRAYIDWPHSYTTLAGKDVIITAAHAVPFNLDTPPGQVEALPKDGIIKVSTGEGYLRIERLKPSGKREMTARAFLAGYGKFFSDAT